MNMSGRNTTLSVFIVCVVSLQLCTIHTIVVKLTVENVVMLVAVMLSPVVSMNCMTGGQSPLYSR